MYTKLLYILIYFYKYYIVVRLSINLIANATIYTHDLDYHALKMLTFLSENKKILLANFWSFGSTAGNKYQEWPIWNMKKWQPSGCNCNIAWLGRFQLLWSVLLEVWNNTQDDRVTTGKSLILTRPQANPNPRTNTTSRKTCETMYWLGNWINTSRTSKHTKQIRDYI